MAHKMKGSEFYGKGNQSPAKQYDYGKNSASPYEAGHTDDDSFEKSMGKIADRNLKEEEKKQGEKLLKHGKKKVDYMQHVTGVNKNTTGKNLEIRRKNALNYPKQKGNPRKIYSKGNPIG
tara:strand:- start:1207 stop:1566 length:360 start_codon:yes stop_codon:yes gene_type:complete